MHVGEWANDVPGQIAPHDAQMHPPWSEGVRGLAEALRVVLHGLLKRSPHDSKLARGRSLLDPPVRCEHPSGPQLRTRSARRQELGNSGCSIDVAGKDIYAAPGLLRPSTEGDARDHGFISTKLPSESHRQ